MDLQVQFQPQQTHLQEKHINGCQYDYYSIFALDITKYVYICNSNLPIFLCEGISTHKQKQQKLCAA